MTVSTGMAEEQAELTRVENMAQSQRSALQKQYESMQQFNDNLHDKSMGSLKDQVPSSQVQPGRLILRQGKFPTQRSCQQVAGPHGIVGGAVPPQGSP